MSVNDHPNHAESAQDQARAGRFLESCDSTQEQLRRSPHDISWVIARAQHMGRGRRGKRWVSPKATGLYLSWRPSHSGHSGHLSDLDDELLPAISLMAGTAVAQWLESLGVEVTLKWPNDIYARGDKLGGVLCEAHYMSSRRDTARSVLIGIGINLHTSSGLPPRSIALDQLITPEATSKEQVFTLISQRDLSQNTLMTLGEELVMWLERSYLKLLRSGWRGVLDDWRRYQMPIGTPLERVQSGEVIRGHYLGVDERGELILSLESGERLTITTGEVSVCDML